MTDPAPDLVSRLRDSATCKSYAGSAAGKFWLEAADALEAAQARIAELEAENERNRQGFEFHAGRAERERDRAIAAEAKLAKALEALEPFAQFIEGADFMPDDHAITAGSRFARKQLTVGDCRRARATLSSSQDSTS